MDTREIKFIIANTPPFNKLPNREIDKFTELCEVKEYKNEEVLYRQGDAPDYFFLLLKGRVVALTEQDNKEAAIGLLKRGTPFGIISLFNNEPHSVTAKSIEQSTILRIEQERFKEFLYKHPLISLEFTRILSQRIKARIGPKQIFQCKRIGVAGFPASGKITYIANLGLTLKQQTQQKVIAIDIAYQQQDKFTLTSLIGNKDKILILDEFQEKLIQEYIIKGDIDYLLVRINNVSSLSSLLNFLSEHYHFILYKIPLSSRVRDLDDFINPCDYLHFLSLPKREDLIEAGTLIKKWKGENPLNEDKIKVIIAEFNKKYHLHFKAMRQFLSHPIYANLPSYQGQDYARALVRIARQLGEVVLGLALGSGGAYAFSHVGVLKILEENNISIDIICGSSVGAVFSALWALGYKTEDIEKIAKELGRKIHLFSFSWFSFPFRGFIRAKRLENILKGIFGKKTFYDLKHVLKIVAFDFRNKEAIVLEEGLLYKAVAASCAMPGIFEPVRFKDNILLDGGILNPLPTKSLLNYGANKIIAVNITPTRREVVRKHKKRKKFYVLDFIFGSIETMQREFIRQALRVSDVVIHPDMEGLRWTEFDKVEDFIARGEKAAREKLEEVKKLVAS